MRPWGTIFFSWPLSRTLWVGRYFVTKYLGTRITLIVVFVIKFITAPWPTAAYFRGDHFWTFLELFPSKFSTNLYKSLRVSWKSLSGDQAVTQLNQRRNVWNWQARFRKWGDGIVNWFKEAHWSPNRGRQSRGWRGVDLPQRDQIISAHAFLKAN